jgi:hypothetical protein
VWLAGRGRGGALVVGEGVETVFSAMEILQVSSGVAALSTSGLRAIVLPGDNNPVWVIADHDLNGVGAQAASALSARLRNEGHAVHYAIPDAPGSDFNDLLVLRRKPT